MSKFAVIGSRGFPSTYGGFETFVRRLAPYLVAHGDEVTVYGRSGRPGRRMTQGVQTITTRGFDSNALSTLSYGATASAHARNREYDAVLVLNVANGYFLPALTRHGIRTVVNPDGLEWQRGKWNAFGRRVFREGANMTARFADQIVTDSVEIGRIWKEDFDRSSIFIPYGADIETDLPDNKVKEIGLEPSNYVLAVARLVPENNLDLLLDAVAQLPSTLPVVVAGSANKETELTFRLKQLSSTRKNFHWLGHVSDQLLLKQLWAHSAVYFHGHSVGGTNPALLQALGYGAPTLALNTRYNAEVLQRPQQLIPPHAETVASAILELTESENMRREFSDHGRQIITARYLWADVLFAYRRVLGDGSITTGTVDSLVRNRFFPRQSPAAAAAHRSIERLSGAPTSVSQEF